MNLYLSSYRIGHSGQRLKELAGAGTAQIISNALDFSTDAPRLAAGLQREIVELAALGIRAEPLDLREFFGSPQALLHRLAGTSLLWVVGGNCFVLRQAMKLSGLDLFLAAKREDADFVYAGYSAGACVLCPSLEGIHLVDDPGVKAAGYDGEVVWDGLGLIDYYIAPHFRCGHPESDQMEAVVEFYHTRDLPYRTIADGEVILQSTHFKKETSTPPHS